jgi:N6-adenosine-specific RNA methylase IME4
VKQIVISPRGRHSAKPAEVRDRIVRLMGDVPRVELFARERVQGWEARGNEVEANASGEGRQPAPERQG